MLLCLGHVTVRSADFERSERFYCGLLGMRLGPRPAIAVPGRWFYVGDEAVLHVLPRISNETPTACGAIDHFALKSDDLPAFEQRLRAAGQPFEGRRLADTRTWQVFLTDPDGAQVEISFEGQALPGPVQERVMRPEDGGPGHEPPCPIKADNARDRVRPLEEP